MGLGGQESRKAQPGKHCRGKTLSHLHRRDVYNACFTKAYLYLVNQDHSAWTWELDRAGFHFLLNGCTIDDITI